MKRSSLTIKSKTYLPTSRPRKSGIAWCEIYRMTRNRPAPQAVPRRSAPVILCGNIITGSTIAPRRCSQRCASRTWTACRFPPSGPKSDPIARFAQAPPSRLHGRSSGRGQSRSVGRPSAFPRGKILINRDRRLFRIGKNRLNRRPHNRLHSKEPGQKLLPRDRVSGRRRTPRTRRFMGIAERNLVRLPTKESL